MTDKTTAPLETMARAMLAEGTRSPIKLARAAIAALAEAGLVIVPVVPTRKMLKAAHEAECKDASTRRTDYDTIREENEHMARLFHGAMIAAAQEQQP